jgi:hypothetical protein
LTIERRSLLAGLSLMAGAVAASEAEACSIIARQRPVSFSNGACQRSLRNLLKLIEEAPGLSKEKLFERSIEYDNSFDPAVSDALLGRPKVYPVESSDVILGWSLSEGVRDRSPIVLRDINLLKARKGIALYQFTLRRDQYHAEITEDDDCGGIATAAHFGPEDRSYLGLFRNNRLRQVYAFDQWLIELP